MDTDNEMNLDTFTGDTYCYFRSKVFHEKVSWETIIPPYLEAFKNTFIFINMYIVNTGYSSCQTYSS